MVGCRIRIECFKIGSSNEIVSNAKMHMNCCSCNCFIYFNELGFLIRFKHNDLRKQENQLWLPQLRWAQPNEASRLDRMHLVKLSARYDSRALIKTSSVFNGLEDAAAAAVWLWYGGRVVARPQPDRIPNASGMEDSFECELSFVEAVGSEREDRKHKQWTWLFECWPQFHQAGHRVRWYQPVHFQHSKEQHVLSTSIFCCVQNCFNSIGWIWFVCCRQNVEFFSLLQTSINCEFISKAFISSQLY